MGDLKMSKRLSDILATARAVVSQLDLDKALAVVLKKSMEVTRTKAGSVALYDAQTNSLRIHAHRGFSRNFIVNREWKVRRGGLSDRILRAKGVTVISDTTNKTFFSNPVAVKEGIKSLVCVPLVHGKRTVGVLYVDDFTPRKFPKADLQELEILASFAAIAIQHAKAHTVVKHQANTDSLTGLFNRRCFENIMARELQRATRHRRELSLALVDVDDFKKFNDRYGHQAGDEALTILGEAIRKSIRITDVASRYGGDEIVIILPETRLEKAYSLFSRRIKREIESRFSRISGGRFTLTVTIGIASCPQDGTTERDLVLAADRALLDAKKNKPGRMIGCSRPLLAFATP